MQRTHRAWATPADWWKARYADAAARLIARVEPFWRRLASADAGGWELAQVMAVAGFLQGAAALALWNWEIDDAGITFAYARSLAQGHGLVSQPGFSPVEGYSNPTWLLFCALLMKLGLFDISWSPKLMAAACMLLVHYSAFRLIRKDLGQPLWVALVAQVLLGTNASALVWANSGLENALFAALLSFEVRLIVRVGTTGSVTRSLALLFGVVAALLALTRPDGVIFFAALPLSLSWARRHREAVWATIWAGVPFICLTGGYLFFRLKVFGQWVPNTVIMKGGPQPLELARALLLTPGGVSKLAEAFSAVFGVKSFWVVGLVATLLFSARRMLADPRYKGLATVGALAIVEFLVLPDDWMPYQRFATPLVAVSSVFIPLVAAWLVGRRGGAAPTRLICAGALAFLVAANEVKLFKFEPPIALRSVIAEAEEIDSIARELGLQNGSLLSPDMGGALWASDLAAYDMLGLTDARVARTIVRSKREFYDYVFEEVRPTFIKTMEYEVSFARLEDDARFFRDYQLLLGNWRSDGWRPWATAIPGVLLFVRRESVADRATVMKAIRAEHEPRFSTRRYNEL